jgi:hypothetical protein
MDYETGKNFEEIFKALEDINERLKQLEDKPEKTMRIIK